MNKQARGEDRTFTQDEYRAHVTEAWAGYAEVCGTMEKLAKQRDELTCHLKEMTDLAYELAMKSTVLTPRVDPIILNARRLLREI